MGFRKVSWEIVLAGLAFIAIGAYLLNGRTSDSNTHRVRVAPSIPHPPLPPSIVIDLENLQNLKNLKNLRNLEQLEVKLQNLEQILNAQKSGESTSVKVEEIRKELREIEKADFTIQLQNKKLFINKSYDVKEASWTEASPGVYVYRESFDASKLKTLNLNLGFGNINIVGNEGNGGEFVVQATGDLEAAETLRKLVKVQILMKGDGADFEVRPTSNRSVSDRLNLEATLTLPSNIGVKATTQGGHISVDNLEGTQHFKTSGGHIVLNNMSGEIDAQTNGGHITCDQLKGRVNLKTQGGHIKIEDMIGALSAKTGGGHIAITGLEGQGSARTSGGNISTRVVSLSGPLSLNTSAGNINLRLPTDLQTDLTASGTKVVLADIFDFRGSHSDGHLKGTLNGGGVNISAECNFGNVEIESND